MKKQIAFLTGTVLLLVFGDWLIKFLLINLNFNHVINSGISFGLFSQSGMAGLILALVGVIITLILTPVIWQSRDTLSIYGLVFIWSGGLANLLDRLIYAGVVDYIYLSNINVFNLADVYIVIGFIVLVYQYLFKSHAKI